MGNMFNAGSILGIVFLAVGIVLMLVIAPLISSAGEQMYASLRDHCVLTGTNERFTQVVFMPGDDGIGSDLTAPEVISVAAKGNGCALGADTTALADSATEATVAARTPQSNTANLSFGPAAASKIAKDTAITGGKWVVAPSIGRTLQGANNVLLALLTPTVLFALLAGMAINAWKQASSMSSEGMVGKFGQQLGGALGVYILGVVSPTIITNAANWFSLTQQQASAGLLRPVYGIIFDLIPLLLVFGMVGLAALPVWGGIAQKGIQAVRSRYGM